MSIVEHLERHLGTIQCGWNSSSNCADAPPIGTSRVQVVRFENTLWDDAVSYSTLGLSERVKHLSDGRTIRQELLFATHAKYTPAHIASFLLSFAEWVAERDGALLRGQVIGPSTPLVTGARANAVYVSNPVIFPDGISPYVGAPPTTILAWLIPLVSDEADRIRNIGWERFEETLESSDIDFFDLDRDSITF